MNCELSASFAWLANVVKLFINFSLLKKIFNKDNFTKFIFIYCHKILYYLLLKKNNKNKKKN